MRRAKPIAAPAPVLECRGCNQGQLLGRMEGTLDAILEAQKGQGAKLDSLDGRLRHVENRSAVAGAAAALMVALGVELTRWTLRKG